MTLTKPKPMTARKRVFLRGKDFGWMLSRRLVDAVQKRLRVDPEEADRIVEIVGLEFRRLLLEGHATGLPGCPVLYVRRERRKVYNFNRRCWGVATNVTKTRVYVPRPLGAEMRQSVVDRGDIREQYDRERTRVSGDPRPAFQPRKARRLVPRRLSS